MQKENPRNRDEWQETEWTVEEKAEISERRKGETNERRKGDE